MIYYLLKMIKKAQNNRKYNNKMNIFRKKFNMKAKVNHKIHLVIVKVIHPLKIKNRYLLWK